MRSLLVLIARILVSFGLLYLSLRGIDFDTIRSRLSEIKAGWILLAVVVTVVQVFFGALRWREITERCDAPLSVTTAFRFNMIGTFFNQTLPSAIGGDAMRLWLVGRTGAGWRAATYSVLVDRAVGLIALAVIVVGSLPWSFDLIGDAKGRTALVLIDLAAISAGVGFLIVGLLSWHWLRSWWPTRHIHACAVIANRVLFSKTAEPRVAVLSLLIHVLAVVIAWCVVRAIGADASFHQLFLLIPPIMLITMLPISIAGWGVREATMTVAFGYAGLAPADGTVISLLFGATSFIVGAIGGIVWILSTEKAEKMPAVIPDID